MIELSMEPLTQLSQGELTLLTFECLTALHSSEAKWRELKEQGKLQALFRNLNGKNYTLRMAMQEDFISAQKAAVQIILQLAKQQALSFTVISSLYTKVNQLQLENDQRFLQLANTLELLYEDTAEQFQQLNSRVHQLEKKVSLLDWRQSVPYMTFNQALYLQLGDTEKVICVVNDFYIMTNGNWQRADEKYLEYMLRDLQIKKLVSSTDLYDRVNEDEYLRKRLLQGLSLERPLQADLYGEQPLISLVSGLYKKDIIPSFLSNVELAMHLLAQLAVLEHASRLPKSYEVILQSIPHVDMRLKINRTLHLEGNVPLAQCPSITNHVPTAAAHYEYKQQAEALKKALENHKCSVQIIEVY